MKKQFETVEQVWSAIDQGKTVHCGSKAYALTVEPVNAAWRLENGFSMPFSTRGDKCLRVTCTENYFGSLLEKSELSNLFTLEQKMTRLEILCKLHGQQGGTIFEFNRQYGVDFLSLSDGMFEVFILGIKYQKRVK